EVVLSVGVSRIEFNGLSEVSESAFVIPLASQSHAQHDVSARQLCVETQRGAKLSYGSIQLAELTFDLPQLEIHLRRRLERDRAVEFALGSGKIILLGINARQEAMRSGIGGFALHRFAQFLQSTRLIMEV